MDALMQALQFTRDDLAANRRGAVGPFQAARMRRMRNRGLAGGAAALALGIVAAAALLFQGDRMDSRAFTLVGVALTGLNAVLVGLLLQRWLRTSSDVSRPVLQDRGVVKRTVRARPNGRVIGFYVRLDGTPVELRVNKQIFNAFIEGAAYRWYRAAGSRTLLSAEPE